MSKAIAPKVWPPLPKGCNGWRRSTRNGSMFHAHSLGYAACGTLKLDRHKSEAAASLGDLQYWGVCPRCIAAANRSPEEIEA